MSIPKLKTIKRLFAVSGNQCAFPSCTNNLIDLVSGKVLGEICHIKAQKLNGPRYDPEQMDNDRHGFDNLILLCPLHHSIIDSDTESYTVERLNKMKEVHERFFKGKEEVVNDEQLKVLIGKIDVTNNIIFETNHIEQINPIGNQFAQTIQNFSTPINHHNTTSYNDLLSKLYSSEITLSQILAETIKIAIDNLDDDIVKLCKNELTGWPNDDIDIPNYRMLEVYISPLSIKGVSNFTIEEMWKELENRIEFVKKEMFFSEAVPSIEQMLEQNKYHNPNDSFIHLVKNQEEMFPDIKLPNIEVHIYGRGTMYFDLLNGIKNNLSNEILKRIK